MHSDTWLYCHALSLALSSFSWAEQLINSDSLVKCWHENQILLHNRYVICFSSYYLHQCSCLPAFPRVVTPDGRSSHAWTAYHKTLNVHCSKEQASWILCDLMNEFIFWEWNNFPISLLRKLEGSECRNHQNCLMVPGHINVKPIYIS